MGVKLEFIERDDPRWLEGRLRHHEDTYDHLVEMHSHTPSEALHVVIKDAWKLSQYK